MPTQGIFSPGHTAAPPAAGEADKQNCLRHIPEQGNFNIQRTFCSATSENLPGLRDEGNSTEKRKDLEKAAATVHIKSPPAGVLSSAVPKAGESLLPRLALREQGEQAWHGWSISFRGGPR